AARACRGGDQDDVRQSLRQGGLARGGATVGGDRGLRQASDRAEVPDQPEQGPRTLTETPPRSRRASLHGRVVIHGPPMALNIATYPAMTASASTSTDITTTASAIRRRPETSDTAA